MASRFWVGGTGNWDAADTSHWAASSGGGSGSSVPTSSDTVTFDGSSGGGTVTVTANTANVQSITMGAFTGTFDANGFAINTAGVLSISGSGTRTVTLGASTITCGTWTATTTTNLTFNANTSTITQTGATTFNGGGKTYNIVTLTGTTPTIAGTNTFATLTRTGTATKTDSLILSANQTISGTLTINGNSATNRIFVLSSAISGTRTLTAATVSVSNADFRDITGAGAGSWNLSAITGNSGDCGGNSGITFTTPSTQTATGTVSFTWSTHGWTTRVPLPQDDVVINNAFGISQTITMDMPRIGKSLSFTGTTWTTSLTFAMSKAAEIYGSLTMISGLTMSGTTDLTFRGRGSFTFNPCSLTFARNIIFQAPSGTLTFEGDLTIGSGKQFELGEGTVILGSGANNYVLTTPALVNGSIGSGTLTLGSATHIINGASTAWNWINGTLSASTGTIKFTSTSATQLTFKGGSNTYNNIWFSRGASAANITIQGSNTFTDFKDDGSAAHSLLFTDSTTQTVSTFTVSGTAGNLITINSSTTATHSLVKSGGGTVSCDYLNIQHSVATPSSTWYAGTHSTDNQAVATAGSGWIFTAPVIVSANKLLALLGVG